MIYSSTCGYAITALTRIALHRPHSYMLVQEICEQTDLPRYFLAKILQDLARKGLLRSARGRGGGFALARPPEQISLYQIVEAVDGVEGLQQCAAGMAKCDHEQPCPLHDQWQPVRERIETFLRETSLAQMSQALDRKLQVLSQWNGHVPPSPDDVQE